MKINKAINQMLVMTMLIVTTIIIVAETYKGDFSRLATNLAIYPVLCIPYVLNKLSFKLDETICTYIYVFIFIAEFLGCIMNFYALISWFDIFAHFLSGIGSIFVAFYIMLHFHQNPNSNIIYNCIFLLGFAFLIAGMWEIFEYSMDVFTGSNVQHALETGVADTMEDIICAFIGALATIGVYVYEIRKSHKGIITTFITHIANIH